MNPKQMKYTELRLLICQSTEGSITREGAVRLNSILKNDAEARNYYREYIQTNLILKSLFASGQPELLNIEFGAEDPGACGRFDIKLLDELAEYERRAPKVEKTDVQSEKLHSVVHTIPEKRQMSKFNKRIFAACIAAVLFMIGLSYIPQKPYSVDVAVLVDEMDVKWADSRVNFTKGARLFTNQDLLRLDKGLLNIQFDDGVDVVIEGPAKFAIERSGVYMEYGRLFSHVPQTGLGFCVETPAARIVDQGTEFGVQVDVNESAELYVTRGKVQLFAGLAGNNKSSQIVEQSNARRFNASTGLIQTIPFSGDNFTRQFNSETGIVLRGKEHLDLAGILAGKKGISHPGDIVGINLLDGTIVSGEKSQYFKSSNEYRLVESSSLIDGVFIPDGGEGAVTISSAGHVYECPDTSGTNSHCIYMFRGGVERKSKISPVIFDGINIEDTPESILFMHSNSGITIDLEAIEDSVSNYEITSLKARCGITEFVSNLAGRKADVDFCVLVDGKVKFKRELLKVESGVLDIDIEFGKSDRFLTFILTDGLRDTDSSKASPWSNDFFYLVNSQLTLESKWK
ncbi:MAG: NPCBM/NEW2 domain-containing protein [Phycisphaerae bacterium]|jgi:hypothetical protein